MFQNMPLHQIILVNTRTAAEIKAILSLTTPSPFAIRVIREVHSTGAENLILSNHCLIIHFTGATLFPRGDLRPIRGNELIIMFAMLRKIKIAPMMGLRSPIGNKVIRIHLCMSLSVGLWISFVLGFLQIGAPEISSQNLFFSNPEIPFQRSILQEL